MAIITRNKLLEKKSSYQALKDIFIPIEDSPSKKELNRAIRHYSRYGNNGFLPLGTNAPYLFSYTSYH